jgi:dihydrodipicolinate synthase/N-acetylneuraminate lyase
MSNKTMCGVYPILVMPFDEKSRVDDESLRSLVEFNIKCRVHGVGVALGSEVLRLSEAERAQVTRIVVDQARGRVPVVINTSGSGTDLAILYSVTAEQNGADALMIMSPSADGAEVREYYRLISEAVHIPIFIQDTSSAHVGGGLARQIAEESEHVRYIKVESLPTPVSVADAVAHAGGVLTVFGGAGGNYFIEEMRRGSVGTMPSCSQPEAFVEVWNLFQNGDEQGARAAFERNILPLNRLSEQTSSAFYHVNKEVLRRRGVIRTAVVRGPIAPLDDLTRRELDQLIEELYGATNAS